VLHFENALDNRFDACKVLHFERLHDLDNRFYASKCFISKCFLKAHVLEVQFGGEPPRETCEKEGHADAEGLLNWKLKRNRKESKIFHGCT